MACRLNWSIINIVLEDQMVYCSSPTYLEGDNVLVTQTKEKKKKKQCIVKNKGTMHTTRCSCNVQVKKLAVDP